MDEREFIKCFILKYYSQFVKAFDFLKKQKLSLAKDNILIILAIILLVIE